MSADHRRPVVAFAMLVLAAALIVGIQQAEAMSGRLLAAAAGTGVHVHGTLPPVTERPDGRDAAHAAALGPAFGALHDAVGHGVSATAALEMVVGPPTGAGLGDGTVGAEATGAPTRDAAIRARTAPQERAVPRTPAVSRATASTEEASTRPGRAVGHRARSTGGHGSTRQESSPPPPRPAARAQSPTSRRSLGKQVGKHAGKDSAIRDRRAAGPAKHGPRPPGRGRR